MKALLRLTNLTVKFSERLLASSLVLSKLRHFCDFLLAKSEYQRRWEEMHGTTGGSGRKGGGWAERKLGWTQAALKRQFSQKVAVRHFYCEECVYTQLHTAHNGGHSSSASGGLKNGCLSPSSCLRCSCCAVLSKCVCVWMFCYLCELNLYQVLSQNLL